MEQNGTPMVPSTPAIDNSNQKSGNGLKIATAIACVVAACGIVFGVYGMVQGSQKDGQISDLKVQIKDDDGTVTTIETPKIETTTDGVTTVIIPNSSSTGISADELQRYIYIAQWGLKIALPTTLGGISYYYYVMPGYTSLGVSGVSCAEQGQCQYAPEFADLSKTDSPMGSIARFYKGTEPSFGGALKVFTLGDYDYYYSHPQAVYSFDQDEQAWEAESVNLIKDVLTNVNNYSEI